MMFPIVTTVLQGFGSGSYLNNEDLRANGDENDAHEDRILVQASPHVELVADRARVELVVHLPSTACHNMYATKRYPVTDNVPAPTGTNMEDEGRNHCLHTGMQATGNSYIQYPHDYWDTHNIKIGPVHTCIMTNVLKMNVFKYSFTLLSA